MGMFVLLYNRIVLLILFLNKQQPAGGVLLIIRNRQRLKNKIINQFINCFKVQTINKPVEIKISVRKFVNQTVKISIVQKFNEPG
jgi:hypothetical protein